MKEFLISDESVNSHNLIIATDGISLERFKKNPVMFYNHDRNLGVIGKWENIRVSDGKMFATPVFDETDQLGRATKRKVEKGFVNGASIGIDNIEYEPYSNRVMSCELHEVSVCDIPSNANTLQLYHNDKPVSPQFFSKLLLNSKNMDEKELKTLFQTLGLSEGSTFKDVLSAIGELKNRPEEPSSLMLNTFWRKGIISESEKKRLEMAFSDNPTKLKVFLNDKKAEFDTKFDSEYKELLSRNNEKFDFSKLSAVDSNGIKDMAKEHFRVFKELVSSIRGKRLVMDELSLTGSPEDRTGWTLDDYRKKAPNDLKKDPELYLRLVETEKAKR